MAARTKIRLRVKTLTGLSFHVILPNASVTVNAVKKAIEAEMCVPTSAQDLVFRGCSLTRETETLKRLGIGDGAFLVLVLNKKRFREGVCSPEPPRKRRPPFSFLRRLSGRPGSNEGEGEHKEERRKRVLVVDGAKMRSLRGMGFRKEGVMRALLAHKNRMEPALNWLLEHANERWINKPITDEEKAQWMSEGAESAEVGPSSPELRRTRFNIGDLLEHE